MGQTTRVDTPDGGTDAYVATPTTPPAPPILALHAWWGLNQDFKDFVDRLASSGFLVVAPDLFDGAVLATIEDADRRTTEFLHANLEAKRS